MANGIYGISKHQPACIAGHTTDLDIFPQQNETTLINSRTISKRQSPRHGADFREHLRRFIPRSCMISSKGPFRYFCAKSRVDQFIVLAKHRHL